MNDKEKSDSLLNDMNDFKEVMQVITTEIPLLIKQIFSSLYSADIAAEYGRGIGQLYKELHNQGIPEDMIREIVMKYASSINILGDALKNTDGKIQVN